MCGADGNSVLAGWLRLNGLGERFLLVRLAEIEQWEELMLGEANLRRRREFVACGVVEAIARSGGL